MQRTFSNQEMEDQIFAIVCNHKRGTVRGIAHITGFDPLFIESTLNFYAQRGAFKVSESYIYKGDKVNEKIWRVKKKYLQQDIFGAVEDETYEEEAA